MTPKEPWRVVEPWEELMLSLVADLTPEHDA
jgi:hypothetical protein